MTALDSIVNFLLKPILKSVDRGRIPTLDGQLFLDGLHDPVEVLRDRWGTPHIYAHTLPDLVFAQGYVHAQDRLFQMDFNRRLVAGRLSEILGKLALPLDRWMRTLTLRRVAEAEVALLNDETRSMMQSYADGVNTYIRQACGPRSSGSKRQPLPLELTLLGYKPEEWIIADSLAWIKMMAWTLSVNWEHEILRARLIERLGPDLAAELETPHLERWPFSLPAEEIEKLRSLILSSLGETALEKDRLARPFTGPTPYQGLGSNNWTVSGALTKTGMPILANDMHLGLSIPAVWYQNHLVCDQFQLTGIIFPGLPLIISGHNGHVAWGLTNGFPDVQDLYMERLRRLPEGQAQVEYDGQWEAANVLHETIKIKGGETAIEEVIITRHGPIINSLAPDFASPTNPLGVDSTPGEQPLALRWTSLEPDTITHILLNFARARNCQEFHTALQVWTTPTQNFVYADTAGNIGYTFPGKIPVRRKGEGKIPSPGWTSEYEWDGYLPYAALPHLSNPAQGFIATANNRIFDSYPIPIPLESIAGDRIQSITRWLKAAKPGQIDLAYIQRMQFDQISPTAALIGAHLADLDARDASLLPVIALFRNWNGALTADSPTAAVYQVFTRCMLSLMVKPKLGADLTERWMGKGPTPVLAEASYSGEFGSPWLARMLDEPASHWFDLGNGEQRDDVMRLALSNAVDELQIHRPWSWGKLHTLTYNHPLGSAPMLGNVFNRGPYPLGGDHTTIWAAGASYYNLDTKNVVGPPFRMIIDLGNLRNSRCILSPGNSGHLASRHYDDRTQDWFKAGYTPLLWDRSDVEKEVENTLRLHPAAQKA